MMFMEVSNSVISLLSNALSALILDQIGHMASGLYFYILRARYPQLTQNSNFMVMKYDYKSNVASDLMNLLLTLVLLSYCFLIIFMQASFVDFTLKKSYIPAQILTFTLFWMFISIVVFYLCYLPRIKIAEFK